MNTKTKKTKSPPVKQKRSEQLEDDGIKRTTIDLTVQEKKAFNDLNDGFVHTRGKYFKPFAEAVLIQLGKHKDRKEIMRWIFQRG